MIVEEWSRLRHDLRSAFNNLRLSLAAMDTETEATEKLQWLDYMDKAADKCAATVDQILAKAESEAASRS